MDITALLSAFDGVSIVAWFALLVVVFAVFVGLGIYQNRRGEALERDAAESLFAEQRAKRPRRTLPNAHHKEYT